MNVLGLDLSINGTGICADDRAAETLHGTAKMGDERLSRVYDAVLYYSGGRRVSNGSIALGLVGLAMLELSLPHANRGNVMDYVHGAARAALAKNDIPYAYVHPNTLKIFATGDAGADKPAMIDGVQAETGWLPADDNQADAWWLRRMGLAALAGGRGLVGRQLSALSAVEWPEWILPYGAVSTRKLVTQKCRHGSVCLLNGDHWLHPFDVTVCTKPPKSR